MDRPESKTFLKLREAKALTIDEGHSVIEYIKALEEEMLNLQCPVCGYYCLGKGGHECIDKPSLLKGALTPYGIKQYEKTAQMVLIIKNSVNLLTDNTGTKLKETILNDLQLLFDRIVKDYQSKIANKEAQKNPKGE